MKRLIKQDYFFILSMVVLIILQVWKAQFSPGFEDEHFYITLGQRLFLGDSLLFDEWHITQMMSVFIYPLYSLYMILFKSTDGIVFGFRVFYIIFQVLISIALYVKLRKYGVYSIFAVLIFFVYTPFNIMALSYNTMSVGFIALFLCLIPSGVSKYIKLRLILSGIVYALAVLNTPYLAIGYFIFVIMVAIFKISKRKSQCINFQILSYITAGISIAAAVFILFVLSRTNFAEILSSLKYLIDPGHSTGIFMLFLINGYRLLSVFSIFLPLLLLMILACHFDRNKRKYTKLIFYSSVVLVVCSILYVCFVSRFQFELGGYMACLVPFSLLGIITFILLNINDKADYLLFCLVVPFFHGLVIGISSNVGVRTLSSPLVLSCVFTVIILSLFIKEDKNHKYIVIAIVSFFVLNILYFKIAHIYEYGTEWEFTDRIDQGPLKGLMVERNYNLEYTLKLSDIDVINSYQGYIVFISLDVWTYLASINDYGIYSSLNSFYTKEEYLNYLDSYFELHDTKRPLYIYVGKTNKADLDNDDPWFNDYKMVEHLNEGHLFVLGQ